MSKLNDCIKALLISLDYNITEQELEYSLKKFREILANNEVDSIIDNHNCKPPKKITAKCRTFQYFDNKNNYKLTKKDFANIAEQLDLATGTVQKNYYDWKEEKRKEKNELFYRWNKGER